MYETAAEITLLRRMGVSVVTMSGAPEIAQCRDIGIRVASLALVTNWATGISVGPLAHDEVLAAARGAVGDLRRIFELFLAATTS
jgi:purine nucleoside phosphorylase